MDNNVYPSESDLNDFRATLESVPTNFLDGARTLAVFINHTGYGEANLAEAAETMELHTRGWSGCENIVEAAQGTIWWALYWRSTHRGGHYYFQRA